VSVDPLPLLKGSTTWVLDFAQADGGAPITDLVDVESYTWMPVHGHNGNFKPKMTALSPPGRYQFKGFNFTMRGPWQVKMDVSSKNLGQEDLVQFDVCVEDD
jgi:hypothetical protein